MTSTYLQISRPSGRSRDRVLVMATLVVTCPRNDPEKGVRHG
jgi:hypothetical protein